MTLPRDLLAGALEDALAGVTVVAYARNVDNIRRDTVMVRLDSVKPSPYPSARDYRYTLVAVGAKTAPTGPGDDALDALLEHVLDALTTHPSLDGVAWEGAERGTYLDTSHPAYEITISVTHPHENESA